MAAGELDPTPLFTHRFPLDSLGEALELTRAAARRLPEGAGDAVSARYREPPAVRATPTAGSSSPPPRRRLAPHRVPVQASSAGHGSASSASAGSAAPHGGDGRRPMAVEIVAHRRFARGRSAASRRLRWSPVRRAVGTLGRAAGARPRRRRDRDAERAACRAGRGGARSAAWPCSARSRWRAPRPRRADRHRRRAPRRPPARRRLLLPPHRGHAAHPRAWCRGGDLGEVYAADLVFHNAYGPDKPWFHDPRFGRRLRHRPRHPPGRPGARGCSTFPAVERRLEPALFAQGRPAAAGTRGWSRTTPSRSSTSPAARWSASPARGTCRRPRRGDRGDLPRHARRPSLSQRQRLVLRLRRRALRRARAARGSVGRPTTGAAAPRGLGAAPGGKPRASIRRSSSAVAVAAVLDRIYGTLSMSCRDVPHDRRHRRRRVELRARACRERCAAADGTCTWHDACGLTRGTAPTGLPSGSQSAAHRRCRARTARRAIRQPRRARMKAATGSSGWRSRGTTCAAPANGCCALRGALRPDVVHLNQFAFGALAISGADAAGRAFVRAVVVAGGARRGDAAGAGTAIARSCAQGLAGADLVAAPTRGMLDVAGGELRLRRHSAWCCPTAAIRAGYAPGGEEAVRSSRPAGCGTRPRTCAALEAAARRRLPWPVASQADDAGARRQSRAPGAAASSTAGRPARRPALARR